jgi:TIGR00730 family protein
MAIIQSICVFCGSSTGRNPAHAAAARVLGRAMAKSGIRLVYGGGSIGLMGTVARTVLEAGGEVTGIIPEFLVNRERMLDGVDDLVVVDDMHTRKRLMFEQSDAFVALPGGIGTLEEVVEQMTWAQLGRHAKPIVLADVDGFWAPLTHLLTHMAEESFIRPGFELRYLTVTDAEAIVPTIVEAAAGYTESELEGNRESLERM